MKRYLAILVLSISALCRAKPPKLTIFLVVDQFSSHFLPKVGPYLSGGLKALHDKGTCYTNAFFNHATPGTGPGHTLLSTGTFGAFHGIVNNSWYNPAGIRVVCDEDTKDHAAVFNPHGGTYDFGKSARNIVVDTLSDQLMLHSYPHARNIVWSLSHKSRAAIAMAGHLGKAAWVDAKTGLFTTSKAFCNQFPDWIKRFNDCHQIPTKEAAWPSFFPLASPAYQFLDAQNYDFSRATGRVVGTAVPLDTTKPFDPFFLKTPASVKFLFDLATACLEEHYTGADTDRFVLFISVSNLDKTGHVFGPQSIESLDLVYHIDHYLKEFMDHVHALVPAQDVLYILTGDHGIQPIPELVHNQGLSIARRYHYPHIIDHINARIKKSFGVADIIEHFKEPQFYLNQRTLACLDETTQEAIKHHIKQYMLSLPGIRRAWTFEELQRESFADYDLDRYFQRQLYRERSGQVIYAVNPYTTLDTYFPQGKLGTSHITQYAYDTQVPLIWYQPGRFEKKRITTNVYMPQLPVSLATLLEVPRPSAAAASVLPNIDL